MLEEFLETDEFEKLQELPEGEDDRVTLPLPDNERDKVRELLIPLLESPKELPFCDCIQRNLIETARKSYKSESGG